MSIKIFGRLVNKTCTGLQTTRFHAVPYRADNRNLRKFGSTYCHGTTFAPKQCLYQINLSVQDLLAVNAAPLYSVPKVREISLDLVNLIVV